MSINFFPISDNNYYKILSYDALLPNLRYKDEKVYFISKNPIKIKLNDKIEYKNEFLLENISFTGKIYCVNTELNCKIVEKSDDNGLIVNIKFRDGPNIYNQDMQKFARAVEAAILGIDLMEDNNSQISDDYLCNVNQLYDNQTDYDNESNFDNESVYENIYDNESNFDNDNVFDDDNEFFEEKNEDYDNKY
jgi:hypothetical protein